MSRFSPGFIGGGLDQYTKMLLHFDGNLTDTAKPSRTWTARGSAGVSTGSSKFGGYSLDCGSRAGCIDTGDDADFTLGSGDFTVDCWFNLTADHPGGPASLFGTADTTNSLASNSIFANHTPDAGGSYVQFVLYGGGSSVNINVAGISAGAGWRHFAGVRSGNTGYLFLNGVLQASAAVTFGINDPARFAIGRNGAYTVTNNDWQGYIDEFRLSVGIARWTSNFTPPSSPY